MARLVFIHDSGERAEYELRPGRNKIGRVADNDLAVDHESVADHHCEVQLAPGGITVRDLGSATGTWIDALRVDEGRMSVGQTLQVGDVQFIFEHPAPVRVKAPSASGSGSEVERPGSSASGAIDPTQWMHCPRCARWYEPGTTSERRVGATLLQFCPQCGGQCQPGTSPEALAPEREPMTFQQGVMGAFGYALRGNGLTLLSVGAVTLTLTTYAAIAASFVPLLGLLALLILTIGVGGYLFAFLKDVLTSSARGDELVPGWPDVTSAAEFVSNFFQMVCMFLFCFGPALLWGRLAPDGSAAWVSYLLVGLGALYFPMALVGVALADSIAGLNPVVILPSIVRIFGHYLIVCALMVCLVAVQLTGEWLAKVMPVPILPTFGMHFITLYLVVVIGRVLGALYYVNRGRLGWLR